MSTPIPTTQGPANERAELSRESSLESFARRAKEPKEGNRSITVTLPDGKKKVTSAGCGKTHMLLD